MKRKWKDDCLRPPEDRLQSLPSFACKSITSQPLLTFPSSRFSCPPTSATAGWLKFYSKHGGGGRGRRIINQKQSADFTQQRRLIEANVRDQISRAPLSHAAAHQANTKRSHLALLGRFSKRLAAPLAKHHPLIHGGHMSPPRLCEVMQPKGGGNSAGPSHSSLTTARY